MQQSNKSSTCGTAAAVESTATQCWWRLWRQLWRMTGGRGGVGGGIGDGIGGTVAMVGKTTINSKVAATMMETVVMVSGAHV